MTAAAMRQGPLDRGMAGHHPHLSLSWPWTALSSPQPRTENVVGGAADVQTSWVEAVSEATLSQTLILLGVGSLGL